MARPTLWTLPSTDITETTARLNGKLVDDGGHQCFVLFQYENTKYPYTPYSTPLIGPVNAPYTYSQVINTPVSWYGCKYIAQGYNDEGYASGGKIVLWLRFTPPSPYGTPWLVLSQQTTANHKDITWKCTTDIACHLTIRISDKPPFKLTERHYKRGTVYYHGTKVNFSWTSEHTQQEAGDTIEHTFTFTVPLYCRIYYWYARGTVEGVPSSSRSPFFTYHPYAQEGAEELIASYPFGGHLGFKVFDGYCSGPTFLIPPKDYHLTRYKFFCVVSDTPPPLNIFFAETKDWLPITILDSISIPYTQINPTDLTEINIADRNIQYQSGKTYAVYYTCPGANPRNAYDMSWAYYGAANSAVLNSATGPEHFGVDHTRGQHWEIYGNPIY